MSKIAFVFAAFFLVSDGVYANAHRLVGIAYSTFHTRASWQSSWGTPKLGYYASSDSYVIAQHANWLADAGVDFILVDWSNDLPYLPGCNCRHDLQVIEDATYSVFDIYEKIVKHPKIAVMIGFPDAPTAVTNGALRKKADQVYRDFIADKSRKALYQMYEEKPLLVIYMGTPSPFQTQVPAWNDARFTVRWMTGFLTEQPNLLGPDRVSKYGFWSWEDRGPQTYTIEHDHPEAMTITASWREDMNDHVPARTRMGGATFLDEWERARLKNVNMALVVSWNEWGISEQISQEASKDLEPSIEFGDFYLKLLATQISLFKSH